MKTLSTLFPNASQACRLLNAVDLPEKSKVKRGAMNKTESEFALILEAQKRAGEILRYEFEGITLRWADMRYTPDFVVFRPKSIEVELNSVQSTEIEVAPEIVLIEVKGAFTGGKFERAIERFRHARTYWPEFQFELHQKTKSGWKRKF